MAFGKGVITGAPVAALVAVAIAGALAIVLAFPGGVARSARRIQRGPGLNGNATAVRAASAPQRVVLWPAMAAGGGPWAPQLGLPVRGDSPAVTLPFPPDPHDRPVRPGEVPSLYADGLPCSTGCRPPGAQLGWPLRPFHIQHAIRAGLNELRPGSMHVAIDIQARDGQRVYAVQAGVAHVFGQWGPNARVQVGNYIYWHIHPDVRNGQWVTPFHTILGTVLLDYGHVAFSEVNAAGDYVNPLRPGGTVLVPWSDTVRPVIGPPSVSPGGGVVVSAYAPQSYIRFTTYFTPVLAIAGLAYRLYRPDGSPVTPLEWSFRGTHLLPFSERWRIYAPGAHAPGFACFARRPVCVPDWTYRVAGGLAPALPTWLAPGTYRLTIYAYNWADLATALDTTVQLTRHGWRPLGHYPAALLGRSSAGR